MLALAAGICLSAASAPGSGPPAIPSTPGTQVGTELARGAATVAAITAKKYPHSTTYRLIRARLEKNVQEGADSDGFLVGAHLAISSWLWNLPTDLKWRETAIARHADIATLLLPRIGLPPEETAHIVARAAGLTAPAEHQILAFVRKAVR